MEEWNGYWNKLDQSIIVYQVSSGKVYGGSDPERTVRKKDPQGCLPGGDYTMELDLSNRTFVMTVNNEKITLDGNIGDFQFSPIFIMNCYSPEVTLL